MRALLLLIPLAACNSELTPAGYAMWDGAERVTTSRATGGYVNYGGAPLRAWKIDLAATGGCGDPSNVIELEINLLADGSGIPVATIPIRATEAPQALPSALGRYNGALVTAGSITVESVTDTLITGSFTATTASGEVTGEFGAPVCASQ